MADINPELKQKFENEDLSEQAQQIIMSQLADEQAQQQLLDDINNFPPSDVYVNYKDEYSKIKEYTNLPKNDYGTGTNMSVSTLISYQQATDNHIAFFDPAYAHFGATGDEKQEAIDEELKDLSSPTLLCGDVITEDKELNQNYTDTLERVINSTHFKKFEKVIIPISLAETTGNNNVRRHSVSLIMSPQDNKYVFIDQGGNNDGYNTIKDKIRQVLASSGYNGQENEAQVVANRMDCAIFAAMINEAAISKTPDELLQYAQKLTAKPDNEVQQQVDNYNQQCKEKTQTAFWAQYENNPMFKLFLKGKNITNYGSMSFAEKQALFDSFIEHNTLTIGEHERDDRPQDPTWKEEVRTAVKLASDERHTVFEEYQDSEHPELLCFRKGDENKMVFSSRSHVEVEGDQETFDTLVLSAKKMNMNKINFGKFEEHPEYKAKLYLACLKYGLEMIGNVPSQQELQQYSGEYAEIQKIQQEQQQIKAKEELKQAYNESEDKFKAASNNFKTAAQDPGNPLNGLMTELKTKQQEARKPENRDNQTLKDEIKAQKEAIKATPEGTALAQAVEEKSKCYQKALEAGLIQEDELKEHKKTTHKKLVQKEGESREDFTTRQEEWNKNESDTHRFNRELNREVINHALRSRSGR